MIDTSVFRIFVLLEHLALASEKLWYLSDTGYFPKVLCLLTFHTHSPWTSVWHTTSTLEARD